MSARKTDENQGQNTKAKKTKAGGGETGNDIYKRCNN